VHLIDYNLRSPWVKVPKYDTVNKSFPILGKTQVGVYIFTRTSLPIAAAIYLWTDGRAYDFINFVHGVKEVRIYDIRESIGGDDRR